MNRQSIVGFLLAAGSGACAANDDGSTKTISQAIVHGVTDDADPAVVRIAAANCSGTLIGPRVVLTAAHCDVTNGDEIVLGGGALALVLAFHKHPAFDGDTLRNDLAMVVLNTSSNATTVPIWSGTWDDSFVGRQVRVVGYGSTGDGGSAGIKRSGFTTIRAYLDTSFVDDAEPSATCLGDSGGPALISEGGVEYVAGIASRGDEACATFGVKTRVDAFASFVNGELADATLGAIPVGQSCDFDEACDSGRCLTAIDSPVVRYCSSACVADLDCPFPMYCGSAVCRYKRPSPGALGARCELDADCAGGLCAAREFGGARSCSSLCVPSAVAPCPAGYACARTEGDAGISACFARPVAPPTADVTGCEAGRAADPPTSWRLILGAGIALVGSRRLRIGLRRNGRNCARRQFQ